MTNEQCEKHRELYEYRLASLHEAQWYIDYGYFCESDWLYLGMTEQDVVEFKKWLNGV